MKIKGITVKGGSVLLEVQILEGEMCLHDARGLHSGPQHVLLCGDVIWLAYPRQVI